MRAHYASLQQLLLTALAEQRDPYAKGDIKPTNIYKWDQ